MAHLGKALKMISTRTISIDPRKLKLLELNARYMRHEVFARLVENLKADGGLLGDTPFAWRVHDDETQTPIANADGEPVYEVLSGNHRTKASVVAGFEQITVVVTDDYLPPDKRRAIQLSRNAITGEDDPATLKLIYESISDHTLKLYTGLDDKQLALLNDVNAASLSEANLTFTTISMTFLPEELEALDATLTAARKSFKANAHWLARFADYDKALDALETAGQAYGIKNTATTLMLIFDIFNRHRTDLQDGYLDAEGNALAPKNRVPISTVLNDDQLPAALAAKLKKSLAKLDKDPLTALDKLIEAGAK